MAEPLLGAVLVLDVGPPGHGGSCIARHEGRVVFVRHALPGERVRARITEDRHSSFLRADAIEVLVASADRVQPPCPHAGPGRCGGCAWQHASADAQRELKAAVIREQFARLAGLEVDPVVEALSGGLLGWRTRIAYAVDSAGRPGLQRNRSHQIERLTACPLGVPGVGDSPALAQRWHGLTGVEPVSDDEGNRALLAHRAAARRSPRGRRPPDRITLQSGAARMHYRLHERVFDVDVSGFWQVHPHALSTIATALTAALQPRGRDAVLELYAGAGPLTAVLAEAVGPSGRIVGFEASRRAVADAAANLADLPWAEVRQGRVDARLIRSLDVSPDLVVLDPPRAGAGRDVLAALLEREPRAIGYVSCEPATLARDVRYAVDAGWTLRLLRGFDAFPMTHHVECLALLEPGAPG